jgi:hypothetical protein
MWQLEWTGSLAQLASFPFFYFRRRPAVQRPGQLLAPGFSGAKISVL